MVHSRPKSKKKKKKVKLTGFLKQIPSEMSIIIYYQYKKLSTWFSTLSLRESCILRNTSGWIQFSNIFQHTWLGLQDYLYWLNRKSYLPFPLGILDFHFYIYFICHFIYSIRGNTYPKNDGLCIYNYDNFRIHVYWTFYYLV